VDGHLSLKHLPIIVMVQKQNLHFVKLQISGIQTEAPKMIYWKRAGLMRENLLQMHREEKV